MAKETEKVLEKIQYTFMIKPLSKLGILANFLNLINLVSKTKSKPKLYVILQLMVTYRPSYPMIRENTRCFSLTRAIQHCIEDHS